MLDVLYYFIVFRDDDVTTQRAKAKRPPFAQDNYLQSAMLLHSPSMFPKRSQSRRRAEQK